LGGGADLLKNRSFCLLLLSPAPYTFECAAQAITSAQRPSPATEGRRPITRNDAARRPARGTELEELLLLKLPKAPRRWGQAAKVRQLLVGSLLQ
jgi:hypothetical protein